MQLRIQKWGKSACVRLPTVLLEQIGARIGSVLEVVVTNGSLIFQPVRRRSYTLSELLAEMPGDSFPRGEGWDEMPAVGREFR